MSQEIDQNWVNAQTWPIDVSSSITYTLVEDIILDSSNQYFDISANDVTIDGSNNSINFNNIIDYPGLVKNGSIMKPDNNPPKMEEDPVLGNSNYKQSFNNLEIENLRLIKSESSTIKNYAGWLVHAGSYYESSGNKIHNCLINCDLINNSNPIPNSNGRYIAAGFIGSYSLWGNYNTSNVNDDISNNIVRTSIEITKCIYQGTFVSSNIDSGLSGLIGSDSANYNANVIIDKCISYPDIKTNGSCGFIGGGSLWVASNLTMTKCLYLGSLLINAPVLYGGYSYGSGGFLGNSCCWNANANTVQKHKGKVDISGCFFNGDQCLYTNGMILSPYMNGSAQGQGSASDITVSNCLSLYASGNGQLAGVGTTPPSDSNQKSKGVPQGTTSYNNNYTNIRADFNNEDAHDTLISVSKIISNSNAVYYDPNGLDTTNIPYMLQWIADGAVLLTQKFIDKNNYADISMNTSVLLLEDISLNKQQSLIINGSDVVFFGNNNTIYIDLSDNNWGGLIKSNSDVSFNTLTINNLTITSIKDQYLHYENGYFIGRQVGESIDSSYNIYFNNCNVTGNLNLGQTNPPVSNSNNSEAALYGPSNSYNGGFIGLVYSKGNYYLKNCRSEAKFNGNNNVSCGGFVGGGISQSLIMQSCSYNNDTIKGQCCGGYLGSPIDNTTIINSYVEANVTGESVNFLNDLWGNEDYSNEQIGGGFNGGYIGQPFGSSPFGSSPLNTISPNYRINIENSYFKGDISGIDNTGFVAGVDSSYNLLIKNSYVHGDIDGFNFETVIDQKQSSYPIRSGLTWIAQTFTPALTGKLTKLDLYLGNYSPGNGNENVAYINIYDGSYLSQSSLSASISSRSISFGEEEFQQQSPQQQSPKWYSIDLDVDLSAGHIYTFDISAAGSVQVGWIYGNNNSYSRGSSSLSLDFDIAFRTYMEVESISTPFITGDATSDISLVNSYYYGTADASVVIFDQSASLVDVYSTEVWDNTNADLSLNSATVYTDNNIKTWFAQKYVNTPYKLFWEDNTGVLNVDQSYVDMMTEPHISSVNVYVTEDIIIDASYKYFILDVSGSQENDVIVFDGNNFNIDISVSNIWSGLVHANEPNNENTDLFVSDVSMSVSSGELDNSAGWICSKNFGKAYNSTNIYNCKTNGIITGIGSGGIVGSNMGENTTGNNRLSYCYTTGDISGENSGGIAGANAGKNSKSLTIDKCYTIGNVLGSQGGGLLGNYGGIDCSNLLIENCYTIGYLDAPFGGCGIGFNLGQGQGSYCAIENFYSRGDLSGNDSFGVTGINNNFSYPINKPRMYINNCYIGGNISGDKSCGLFNLENNVGDLSINNIYLYGIIDQSYTPLYNTYSLLRSGNPITNSPTIDISNVIVSTYNSLDISAYLYSDLISDNSLNITDISYVTTPGTWSNSKANKALENVYKFSNSTPPLTSDVWIESNTNNAPYDLIWQGYNHTEEIDFSLVVLLMDASYSITDTSLIPFNSTKYQSAGSRKIDLPNGLYEYELSYNNITDLSSGLTFNNYAYPDNLIKILSFGNIPLEGISGYQFADLSFSLPDNSNSVPTILQNTSLKGAFYNSRVIDTAKNINNWDVTNVTDMSGTFLKSSFNQVINNWNVRNVTNMESMFMDSSFNKGLLDWSLNSLKNMNYLFKNTNFNRNITKWNTDTVETMTATFSQTPFDQAIGSWNVSNVTSMNSMFHSDFSFNQDISGWKTGKVTDMSGMFLDNSIFNQDIRYWDVSIDTSLNNMFQGVTIMLN